MIPKEQFNMMRMANMDVDICKSLLGYVNMFKSFGMQITDLGRY